MQSKGKASLGLTAAKPASRRGRKRAGPKESPQQLLAAIVEYSDDAIFSVSLEGHIVSWNPAAARIFGYSATEAQHQSLLNLFPAERLEEGQQLLARIKAGDHVERYETIHRRKNDRRINVSLTISPTRNLAGGRIIGAAIIARDVTEQVRAEEKLRHSEAFYHSLVEHLPQYIFRKDLNERFTFANQRFCQILGRPIEDVIGKTDFDFFPPELATKYQRDDRHVIQTGLPLETVEANQPPGSKKIFVNVCKTPIFDVAGKIIGVQGIFWDITEQEEAEIALRHSEERYRKLLGSVTDYIYTVELKEGQAAATHHGPGCVNVTGYTPEDYQKTPMLWYLMVPEDDRPAVIQQAARVLQGQANPLEHRIFHKDGSVRWVRNTQVPRYDEQGHLAAYDGLVSDITERKVAEEKLLRANAELAQSRQGLMNALDDLKKSHEELKAAQMLLIRAEKLESVGRLAAGIAHEVKNPLAIMLTGLDYLASAPACVDPNVGMVCQDMKDALGRADTVIRGLLDFAASQELGVQPENLNEALERALKLLRHDLNRNRIEVNKQLAANLPIVMLDRAKMEQVFVNLIINAIYAMPNGGTLTVRTFDRQVRPDELCPGTGYRATDRFQAGEQVVVVEVDDTGTGIPSDKLSMLFEPFFTTKPTGQGTGLGLAVTKKIIDMHGGTIGLHNRPEGGVRATIMVKAADPK